MGSIDIHNGKTLLLQAGDGSASMMVNSNAAENLNSADKTKLVFNQYGNRYFLSRIWVADQQPAPPSDLMDFVQAFRRAFLACIPHPIEADWDPPNASESAG